MNEKVRRRGHGLKGHLQVRKGRTQLQPSKKAHMMWKRLPCQDLGGILTDTGHRESKNVCELQHA